MNKVTRSLLLLLALVLLVAGCSAQPAATPAPSPEVTPVPEVSVPVQDIADDLLSMENQFSSMADFGAEYITEMCGLDYSMLEEYSLNDAMMNVNSHILYVAKVKNAEDMEAVHAAFQKRLELMQEIFSQYLPEPYELAKNGQIAENGRYILLVVAEDAQAVVDRFSELLAQ